MHGKQNAERVGDVVWDIPDLIVEKAIKFRDTGQRCRHPLPWRGAGDVACSRTGKGYFS